MKEDKIEEINEEDEEEDVSVGPSKQKKGLGPRKRLTKTQITWLTKEFTSNPNWSQKKINEFGKELDMSSSAIYKWNWDRKKKLGIKHEKMKKESPFNQNYDMYMKACEFV